MKRETINTGSGHKNNLTAVVESWGYFIGNTFNATKYSTLPAVLNRERAQLEENVPVDNISVQTWNTGSQGWIPIGFPHDLIDVGEPATTGVVDNVANYTISGIFRGFNTSSATIPQLRDQILLNNGNWQAANVNTLVTSYRY